MVKRDISKTINFDERKKETVIRKHVTETYNKEEIYNIYQNLRQQLEGLEKSIEQIKGDLKVLEPIYLKIKEEVEKTKVMEFKKK